MRRLRSFSAAAFAAYVAAAVFLFWTTWRAPTHRWIGGEGDAEILIWHLRWLPHALGSGLEPLVSHQLDAPDGFNLMWNASLLVPALVLTPVTLLAGVVFAYNLLVTLALALSAWCAFRVFARWTRPGAAAVGGLVYGFSPFMLAQANGHVHIALALFPPLVLLLLDDLFVHQRRPAWLVGGALGLAVALQLLTGEEVLALTALVAGVGVGLIAVLHRGEVRRRLPYAARALGVAAAVAAVVCAYPLSVQFFGPQHVKGTIQPANTFVLDAVEPVVPTPQQRLTTAAANRTVAKFSGPTELGGYVGLPLVLLVVFVAIRFRRDPLVRFAALLALAVLVLALGPRLHVAGHSTGVRLPWVVVQRLPLFHSALPARLALFLFLLVGLLVAVFLDRARLRAFPVAVAILTLVPLVPNLRYPSTDAASPAFFRRDLHGFRAGTTVLVLPLTRGLVSPRPMLWQAEADMSFRMPEGYVLVPGPTFNPPAIARYGSTFFARLLEIDAGRSPPKPSPRERAQMVCELGAFDIGAFVIGPGTQNAARAASFLTAVVGRAPTATGGVDLWPAVPKTRTACGLARFEQGWYDLEAGPAGTFHWLHTDGTLSVTAYGRPAPLELSFLARSAGVDRRLTVAGAAHVIPAGHDVRVSVPLGRVRHTLLHLHVTPAAAPQPTDQRKVSIAVSDAVVERRATSASTRR